MRILLMTDNPGLCTGMGKVGREIALALHAGGHEVLYIGWCRSAPFQQKWPFDLYPVENSTFGKEAFDRIVAQRRPDVVMTIGDPWMYGYIADRNVCKTRGLFQWVGYIAVDGEKIEGGLPNFWKGIVNDMDRIVAYTEYGKNALLKTFPERKNEIDVVYHGVDDKIFHPIPEEERNILRKRYGIENKFVFLSVARNQGRKNWPQLFKAWKIIIENKMCPNAVLWPHTYFYDRSGHNMDDLLDTFGLDDTQSVIFFDKIAHGDNSIDLIPEVGLNSLYNASDVLVLVGGEGFGLPIIEAMAVKLPCLVLGDSASGELAGAGDERAVTIAPKYYATGKYLTERPVVDSEELAQRMKTIYDASEQRKGVIEPAYSFALDHTWEKIGKKWIKWFDKFSNPTSYPLILEEICS